MKDNKLTKLEEFLQPAPIRDVEVKDKKNQTSIFQLISIQEFANIWETNGIIEDDEIPDGVVDVFCLSKDHIDDLLLERIKAGINYFKTWNYFKHFGTEYRDMDEVHQKLRKLK